MREYDPLSSPAQAYHRRVCSQPVASSSSTTESALLQQIRSLIGSASTSPLPHTTSTKSAHFFSSNESLTWFDRTVLYYDGVTLLRQWNFAHEGDEGAVRHACWVWFPIPASARAEQDAVPVSGSSLKGKEKENGPTFGAFHQTMFGHHPREHSGATSVAGQQAWRNITLQRGVCIFLRDVCRIFFASGDEYTVNLPFTVNSASPLYPSGLIVQREVDIADIQDADRLPTLYSLSHPFDELRPIPIAPSVTGYIFYGRYLFSEDLWRISAGPPPSMGGIPDTSPALPADEVILWVADRITIPDPIAISYNRAKGQLSIWLILSIANGHDGSNRRKSKKGLGGPLGPGDRDRRVSAIRPSTAAEGKNAMRIFSTSTAPVDAKTVQAAAAATAAGQKPGSQYSQIRQQQDPFSTLPSSSSLSQSQSMIPEQEKIQPQCLLTRLLSVDGLQCTDLSQISIHVFDMRDTHSLLAIRFPTHEVLLYELQRHAENLSVTRKGSMSALSMSSLNALREDITDLVLVREDGSVRIMMTNEAFLDFRIFRSMEGDQISYGLRLVDHENMWEADEIHALKVEDPCGSALTFTLEDSQKIVLDMDLTPNSPLAKSCLQGVCFALPPQESFHLIRNWLKSRSLLVHGADDFECLCNVLIDAYLPGNEAYCQKAERSPQRSSWDQLNDTITFDIMIHDPSLQSLRHCAPTSIRYPTTTAIPSPSPYIAPILMALHLLAEDYKAYLTKFDELKRLVTLVVRFACIAQKEWAQYWLRECPSAVDAICLTGEALQSATLDVRLDFPPPDLMAYLGAYFTQESKQRYFILPHLGKFFGLNVSNILGVTDPCRRSSILLEISSALRSAQDGALHVSQAVQLMCVYGLTAEQLNTLPISMALPLWEALRKTRYRPPSSAPRRFYSLCGRDDLALTIFGTDRTLNVTESYKQRNEMDHEAQTSIAKLYGEAYVSLAGRAKEETTGVGDPRVRHFTDIRFPEDYRLREVETMLRSSRTCVIRVQDRPDTSDHDLANEHQMLIMRIAERTLSLPLGRAALTFATVPTAQADSYTLPPLEFAVKILPQGSVLNLDGARLTDEVRYWTEFNNAVAAALRIAPATKGVDYSWIILLSKPPELSSKHAGFIYGLGLTGHLRSMLPFQAFGYLAPKHNFTTMAVLLGLAAAHCGTGNETITQMISVHTPALLPPNSAELNIPVLTQTAGLMGLGLLYMGTRNRKMARVALREISRKDLVKPGQTDEHRESYALSAGFAFGFIMVGKGAQSNPADMAMVQQLQHLIHGECPSIDVFKYQKPNFDVTVTAPAAIVALMLMYMRTERQDIADLLRPPKTREELTHYAPYLIMFRTIARSVIMWNSISLKLEWLHANLPDFISRLLKSGPSAGQVLAHLDDASSFAYMYTIAGLCFGIGLRYAGSAEPEALTRLSMLHDAANKAMALSVTGYDQRIKRFAYKECVGTIQLAMAMVAAGTGELSIFQRLRIAHGQYNNVRYGTHVATHLSLGLLFLGNGRYTLGNSNAAIACLLAALYPRFPNNAADNRAHPQILRHLWVLAAEPRCLMTRDVDTGRIVGLPVRLRKREGNVDSVMRMMAPSLLPEIEKIITLEVDSPRYSPLNLDIMHNARHRAGMIRDQTMWVKRQPGFLTYEEDIRGTRNINLHTNVAYLDTLPLDYPSELPLDTEVTEHLFSFIESSAHGLRTVAFAKYFCRQIGTLPRENSLFAFSHAALVECLALDKLNMLHTYLAVFLSRYKHPGDSVDTITMLRSLRIAATFYETQFSRFTVEGMSVNRCVTLRPSLIQSALHEAEKKADALSMDPRFRAVLRGYIRGEGLTPQGPSVDDPEPIADVSMQPEDGDEGEMDPVVLARDLAFFLAVYNFPSLQVMLQARGRGRAAAQVMQSSYPEAASQFPSWLALMLLKGNARMNGYRQLPSERITTRAVEEVIKAWTR